MFLFFFIKIEFVAERLLDDVNVALKEFLRKRGLQTSGREDGCRNKNSLRYLRLAYSCSFTLVF